MLLRPTNQDLRTVVYYIGRLTVALGVMMVIPLIVALIFKEWDPAVDFFFSMSLTICVGMFLQRLFPSHKDMNWSQGLAITSLSWLMAMFFGAIPLALSRHFNSYLDACFDAMSAFATTGLSLINHLDHAAYSINMWRHLMMFIGGQGIVLIGLTFFVKGTAGAYRLYVGEAREEKVLPNVIHTARFIWLISIVYLLIGTTFLAIIGFLEGIPPVRAILHGLWIFMAGFDTGGFAPMSQSILYYHSFPYELVTMLFMVLGTINFGLQYAIWSGKFKEVFKNLETRTLLASVATLFVFMTIGLTRFHTYPNWISIFRKGFYQLLSAHSGTGFMTIYPQQFAYEWSYLALTVIIIAMGIGGSACSTAGGIKILRIGILFKSIMQDIRRIMAPGSAVVIEKFHHLKDIMLGDKLVRSSLVIMILYLITYLIGTIVGHFYGYPLDKAMFESVSATANVGLSTGITNPSMPDGLKITYIIQMWVGRLEFMAVFILIGLIVARFRGAKGRSK